MTCVENIVFLLYRALRETKRTWPEKSYSQNKCHFLTAVIKQNLHFEGMEHKQTTIAQLQIIHIHIFGTYSQMNMGGLGVFPVLKDAR